jgi:RHS repeat-associated protein
MESERSIGNASRANGNATGSAMGAESFGFGYNGRNRLSVVQRDGATVGTYTYNALGQRVLKMATLPTSITQRYGYDGSSHLIGEYGDGTTARDYIWLGDLPVAVADTYLVGGLSFRFVTTINYVHADDLGTPRVVTDSAGSTIWQWAYVGNPFGEQPPTSTTGYVLNLRYPGQYFDQETGLISNGFRDCYEPATGRYCQSDPIGLDGGLSTYAYVGNNPLSYTDPLGLQVYEAVEERDDEMESWAGRGRLVPIPLPPPETRSQQETRWKTCPQTNELPKDDSQLGHIFDDRPGHLPNNWTNQNLITDLVNNYDNYRGPDRYGNSVYTAPMTDGSNSQLWATTRNGIIKNAGMNLTPWTYIPNHGLTPGK